MGPYTDEQIAALAADPELTPEELEAIAHVEALVEEAVGTETLPGSPDGEAGGSTEPAVAIDAPAPPAPPSREEMRERIRSRLADGTITVEDVLADMYASMYWTETQIMPAVTGFFGQMAAFSESPMARRLFGKGKRRKGADDGDQD